MVDGELRSCGVFDTIELARARARAIHEATKPAGAGLTVGV